MQDAGLMPELEAFLDDIEAVAGINLPPGYNPDLKFMRHLWDDVPHVYRPLVFYFVMELLEVLCHISLRATGFTKHTIRGIDYYTSNLPPQQATKQQHEANGPGSLPHGSLQTQEQQPVAMAAQASSTWQREAKALKRKAVSSGLSGVSMQQQLQAESKEQQQGQSAMQEQQHTPPLQQEEQRNSRGTSRQGSVGVTSSDSAAPTGLPLVFMHGVGAGLLPYLGVVFALAALKRPMLLPVSKHVSMRLTQVRINSFLVYFGVMLLQ
jgi:hypothetical protein